MTAQTTGIRCRTTARAQRSPNEMGPSAASVSREACPLRPSTRGPRKPSSAGSRVNAIATATATVPAAARPIAVRNGIPTTDSATRAMMTVAPAKTTAEPAVPPARPAASSPSRPASSSWRYRETMNNA